MERILGSSEKLIFDSGSAGQGVVPYLPLNELSPRRAPAASGASPQNTGGGSR